MHKHRLAALLGLALLTACAERAPVAPGTAPDLAVSPAAPNVVINEVMADPSAVTDDSGEWFEVHNRGATTVNLQGWKLASNNDAVHTISASVSIPAGGYVVLARKSTGNGGVTVAYAYGTSFSLANTSDWLALRDANGASVDSVSWSSAPPSGASRGVRDPAADNTAMGGANWQTQTTVFGSGDRGTPRARNDGYVTSGVVTVVVTPASASIAVGATRQFAAAATDASGAAVATTFTWTSSNPAVATVSATGLATGVSAGTATITATAANGVAGTATLTVTGAAAQELVVRVLDVGQGDANLITNGTSRVIIDGGPDQARFGALLDSLGLNNSTIDVVILSHQHFDHLSGLRELFRASRNITVRYFFENRDVYGTVSLAELRDSVAARAARGQTIIRDTDDPCGNGAALCTITMTGGAKLHVMRPSNATTDPNNRSTPVKLVGPDSAAFTMWFAGDAEHEAIDWYDNVASYDTYPGMRVNVLKGNHHGSCNGVTSRYVQLTNPDWVTFSLAAVNDYGHVHNQSKDIFNGAAKPWLRTDQNGTVTIRTPGTPGGGYTISGQRGASTSAGPSDRAAASC